MPNGNGSSLIPEVDAINYGDYPATRQEVANYVTNAFQRYHQPDHSLLNHLATVMDTFLIYVELEGLPVVDGRAKFPLNDLVVWASANKDKIAAWKEERAKANQPPEELGRAQA